MNFSNIKNLTIPEGSVTALSIGGIQIWTNNINIPAVLSVAKQTLTTYANETSYADEKFILLDIYPKRSNSTVNVTIVV
jgi:hypothetical protein